MLARIASLLVIIKHVRKYIKNNDLFIVFL
jgi:hypothetical protein